MRADTYFGTTPGAALLVKFNLGHGVYAVPLENLPPVLGVTGDIVSNLLPSAVAGQAWSADLESQDADGTVFYWQLVQAPAGVMLTPSGVISPLVDGYSTQARLTWTPTVRDRVDSEIVVRVQDSRGGVATKRFFVNVAGGNFAPVIDSWGDITLTEGEILFTQLFDQETLRSRIVGMFLAILELIRHHGYRAIQEGLFGEIRVLPPLPPSEAEPQEASPTSASSLLPRPPIEIPPGTEEGGTETPSVEQG